MLWWRFYKWFFDTTESDHVAVIGAPEPIEFNEGLPIDEVVNGDNDDTMSTQELKEKLEKQGHRLGPPRDRMPKLANPPLKCYINKNHTVVRGLTLSDQFSDNIRIRLGTKLNADFFCQIVNKNLNFPDRHIHYQCYDVSSKIIGGHKRHTRLFTDQFTEWRKIEIEGPIEFCTFALECNG